MPWDLAPFAETGLNAGLIDCLLGEHEKCLRPGLDRLWAYYRNHRNTPRAMGAVPGHADGAARGLAQAAGLPGRLTSVDSAGRPHEIVIENDIAWRIDTLVDFLFGKHTASSTAPPPPRTPRALPPSAARCAA